MWNTALHLFLFIIPQILAENTTSTTSTSTTNTNTKAEQNETTSSSVSATTKNPLPSSSEKPDLELKAYDHATPFKGKQGLNNWDPEGSFTKVDLSKIEEGKRPVEDNPSMDHNVLICGGIYGLKGSLRHDFPMLINASLSMTHYVKMTKDQSVNLTGVVVSSQGTEILYNINKEQAYSDYREWTTNTYKLRTNGTNFTVILSWEGNILWALDQLNLRGYEVLSGSVPEANLTTTPIPPLKPNITTTISPDDTTTTTPPTTQPGNTETTTEDSLEDIEALAASMWTAFYVLLALFIGCLCLIFAILARQKCKDDVHATVSPYNPSGARTGSYNVDGARINHAYETDSV